MKGERAVDRKLGTTMVVQLYKKKKRLHQAVLWPLRHLHIALGRLMSHRLTVALRARNEGVLPLLRRLSIFTSCPCHRILCSSYSSCS